MALIERRATGEPIPLITGSTDFLGLDILAAPGVFVPRDSSEFLADPGDPPAEGPQAAGARRPRDRRRARSRSRSPTASRGAASTARMWPRDAVKLARQNAKRLGLKATFSHGGPVRRPAGDARGARRRDHDPPALRRRRRGARICPTRSARWSPRTRSPTGASTAWASSRRTAEEGPRWLATDGWVLIEADPDAARDVKRVMTKAGFRDVKSTKGGELKVTRVVVGRRPR